MKRFILGLSAALGLLFALFIGLFFLNPLAAGILFAETTGTGYGHPKNPPALAAGEEVSAGMSDRAEKARKWTGILEQHFTPGPRPKAAANSATARIQDIGRKANRLL
jgi:hypothetical protein